MKNVIITVENAVDDIEVQDLILGPISGFQHPIQSQAERTPRESALADAVVIATQVASLATATSSILALFKLIPKPNTSIKVKLKDPRTGGEVEIQGDNAADIRKKAEAFLEEGTDST